MWTLNGTAVPGREAYVDLDSGFTPATNLPQLRRLALAEGQAADPPVAWLDVAGGILSVLPQQYERRSEAAYWYEALSVNYQGLLEVGSTGFIRRYPGCRRRNPEAVPSRHPTGRGSRRPRYGARRRSRRIIGFGRSLAAARWAS